MKNIDFEPDAFRDFTEWTRIDNKIFQKIIALLKDVQRSHFEGIGKPEPLKHNLKTYWSRRINDEHRLVYKITENTIIIVSCKNHYE